MDYEKYGNHWIRVKGTAAWLSSFRIPLSKNFKDGFAVNVSIRDEEFEDGALPKKVLLAKIDYMHESLHQYIGQDYDRDLKEYREKNDINGEC